jgi:LemA protein
MDIIIVLVVIGVIVVLGLVLMGMYNGLVKGRLRVKEAWSSIDIQLKRRSSLIPNLVETVRGYASHERETLENVTRARAQLDRAGTAQEAAQANNFLTQTLRSLFAVSEAYPDLKANENFLELQRELSALESEIQMARRYYNGAVRNLNTMVESFPSNLVASQFKFEKREYFEIEDPGDRAVPKVSFQN